MGARLHLLAGFVLASGCSAATVPDVGLEGLSLAKVAPDTIIPGTKLMVQGSSFVDTQWGDATLHLVGTADGSSIDVSWPATFVDFSTMTVAIDGSKIDQVGGAVSFDGTATLEVVAKSDGETYASDSIDVELTFAETLTPNVTGVDSSGLIFVNEKIQVQGANFLLGGDEGVTIAHVAGCYKLETGSTCTPITAQDIPLVPVDPLERDAGVFPFTPKIAGIKPGRFTGTVTITNQQTGKTPVDADATNVDYDLVSPQVFTVCVGDPCVATNIKASLAQYVFVEGGGFVGGDAQQSTELRLTGTFTRTGQAAAPVTMTLIPDFVEGSRVRYIMNSNDELGRALDLRTDTGRFSGTITPVIYYNADSVTGAAKQLTFDIAPVKQVVYLDFRPSYVEGLRDFGLRAVDNRIRARILEVTNETYRGVNIEFRTTAPTDFAKFEHVEITGIDPNNMGLFGYDNTPGKDNGNERLDDRLGGVNAETQEGGYAGYGGVFLRSLLGFSKHPNGLTNEVPGSDVVFDQVFDPFRPDTGGEAVHSSDVSDLAVLTSGADCPAGDRSGKVSCAIWVLGNLIGGTLSHEIGHSLGLANPYAEGFHNAGNGVNRLMDAGGDRSFFERAELEGQGPGVFCDEEYVYLRMIMPSGEPANDVERPGCY